MVPVMSELVVVDDTGLLQSNLSSKCTLGKLEWKEFVREGRMRDGACVCVYICVYAGLLVNSLVN